jgi:hypothetical protein
MQAKGLQNHIQMLTKGRGNKITTFLTASSAAVLTYTAFFQRNFLSKTYLLYCALVFACIFLLTAGLNRWVIVKFIQLKRKVDLRLCLCSAIILSLLLLLNFSPVPFYAFEKDGKLEIRVDATEAVSLTYVRNKLGFIPYAEFDITGNWREEIGRLVLDDGALLTWSGDLGDYLEIGFKPAEAPQNISIFVDGSEYELDLQGKAGGDDIVFRREGKASIPGLLPFMLSFLILSAYFLLVLLCFLSTYSINQSSQPLPKWKMIWLGLPLMVTCVLTLLVFWPGMLTNDSMNQWAEIVSGNYSDLNPLLHTLLLSALVHIAKTPAIVALFQILALILVAVYGWGFYNRSGVSAPILAGLAVIFALWPLTPIMVNTLWKDVLYSFALLALFIFLLEIAVTGGKWLEQRKHYFLLFFSAFLVAIFRLNGSPVALITLAVLPLIYKKYRKGLLIALFSLILAWTVVKGPLQSRFSKSEVSTSALNLTLLHHIAAHLDQGTAMTAGQLDYLDSLLPLPEWQYDCCYMGNIYTHPDFDQTSYMRNFSRNLGITSSLFAQNPAIDIQDQLCASEMDWRFLNNRCTFKSLHPFDFNSTSITSWIPDNEFGLAENSILPQLLPAYYTLLDRIGVFSGVSGPLLRPAFYVYLTIIILISTSIRLKNVKILTAAAPVLLQTGILALINFAPAFRYQYGICLVGLFSIGLLFLPNQNDAQD